MPRETVTQKAARLEKQFESLKKDVDEIIKEHSESGDLCGPALTDILERLSNYGITGNRSFDIRIDSSIHLYDVSFAMVQKGYHPSSNFVINEEFEGELYMAIKDTIDRFFEDKELSVDCDFEFTDSVVDITQ